MGTTTTKLFGGQLIYINYDDLFLSNAVTSSSFTRIALLRLFTFQILR